MNFTFGITTDFSDMSRLNEIKKSIQNLNIPNYEILLIGGARVDDEGDTKHIFFDDSVIDKWITRKKNILAQEASYDNVVIFHDYYVFDENWYKSFLTFGEDWDVCSNAQLLITGKRHFTDWVCWDSPIFTRYTSLDYDNWKHTKNMYQSGGYMIVKKQFMKKYPLNEKLTWGTGEDVEWSIRMRTAANWKCNGTAIVRHNKRHRDANA